MNHVGLILEGGGMRCLYTAGVLDCFLEHNIEIKYCYGVSAGAISGMNYVAKQKKRTYRTVINYIHDKDYCSLKGWLKTGNLFGIDMLYNRIPNILDPFDYDAFKKSESQLMCVVTNIETGRAEYKHLTDMKLDMDWLRASSSLPMMAEIVKLEGRKYLDGGISDSIPIEQSMKDGHLKNIVILTRHKDYHKKPEKLSAFLGGIFYNKYPKTVKVAKNRHLEYNRQLNFVADQQRLGNAFLICPQSKMDISRTEKDLNKLNRLYEQGYADAKEKLKEIKHFINEK